MVARTAAFDEGLWHLAEDERIGRLWPACAFRGLHTLTVLALHLVLGADWKRFSSQRGLLPGSGPPLARAVGDSWAHGQIAETTRRLLVGSAWHYSRRLRRGATLQNGQVGPDNVLQIAWRAQHRPHHL
jgi:hypothetical protein